MKTPYPYLLDLVSNYLENNILSDTVKFNGIESRMSLTYWIKIVAFFLGHPVYRSVCMEVCLNIMKSFITNDGLSAILKILK